MRLFLYGTLLTPSTLARRSGTPSLPHRLTPATLRGWRRVQLLGAPYPTLRRDPAATVRGATLTVGPAVLRRLSAYEGPRYRLTRVVVATPRGKTAAWTWIAAGAGPRPWNGDTDAAATPRPARHARG
jgi:gamma-glutamylcyclotransferase (GGCT)/AIG2-like uncharacterized protein YtfP